MVLTVVNQDNVIRSPIKVLSQFSRELQRRGERRLAVLEGNDDFINQAITTFRQSLAGDWLLIGETPLDDLSTCSPKAYRTLLGQELQHAIFDARSGFHTEAFAALSGTLVAGSWLLLLLPFDYASRLLGDRDSLRWAEVDEPLATPHFTRHLQRTLTAGSQVIYWREGEPLILPQLEPMPTWCGQAPEEQRDILAQLKKQTSPIAILTAPRGRGKSALAGMLAAQQPGTLITAPAKVSTQVIKQFAGENFNFIAPDQLLQLDHQVGANWLIIDEAAAIPAPMLRKLIETRRRVLLTTTTDGYEGTGQGFLLKFCASLDKSLVHYRLKQPLRWSETDPLEQIVDRLLLLTTDSYSQIAVPSKTFYLSSEIWEHSPAIAYQVYALMKAAHYRTTPLDLRRMMDSPSIQIWVKGDGKQCQAALWLNQEGGLSEALSWEVWRGTRRPKGNLVAQSLAAHSHFPQAAQLYSLRINRIAVMAASRRQGVGRQLIRDIIRQSQSQNYDYLSVSFGFTSDLWAFWQACGFHLVRFGTQPEASSGLFAAMAIYPLSSAGNDLVEAATLSLARDWPWLTSNWLAGLSISLPVPISQSLNQEDWQILAGFAWCHRSFHASYPALQRAWQQKPAQFSLPLLAFWLEHTEPTSAVLDLSHKAALVLARKETASLMQVLDQQLADHFAEWILNK